MAPPLLQLSQIGKSFGSHRVLEDVSFELRAGQVHLLAGENGAGKSTLIKILAGLYPDFDGTIELAGRPVRFATPQAARSQGIAVIHQEMSLVEAMTVEDNLMLGREPAKLGGWWRDRAALRSQTRELCRRLLPDLTDEDLTRPVEACSLSIRSRIEIARALAGEARVIVMDEPTSALTRPEIEKLFALIAALKRQGCGIIYISHRMDEVYRIADRITVLREGRVVGTAPAAECPESQLLRWMIGRDRQPARRPEPAAIRSVPCLEVRELGVTRGGPAVVRGVSFDVRQGEIVGLTGLQGAGGTELLEAMAGEHRRTVTGTMRLAGRPFGPTGPRDAIQRGVVHLTSDRRGTGFVPGLSATDNVSLAALPRLSRGGWLRPALERSRARHHAKKLHIRCGSLEQPIENLSGGNQQKVVLAKWLETEPKVLLLDEPTRGIDLGAKEEIHALLRQRSAEGLAILWHTSELAELLAVADRILVLRQGRLAGEFAAAEATEGKLLGVALGLATAAKETVA